MVSGGVSTCRPVQVSKSTPVRCPHDSGAYNLNFDLHAHTTLSPDHALHCGIILNELVTNCIKYAFEGKEKGTITIRLYEEEEHIHFEIKDDGIGFDKEKVTSSFGLMMVQALVRGELKGTLDVQSDKGAQYSIVWKKQR